MPSLRLKARPLENDWAAYQFDAAVMWVGLTIENALNDREEYGPSNARATRPRYTLAKLLEPEFRLPHSGTSQEGLGAMAAANPGLVGHWKQAPKAM